MMRWFRVALRVVAVLLVVAAGLAAVVGAAFVRPVGTSEMAPSLHPDDLLLVIDDDVTPGDIVVLRDPHDPSRKVLRRILAVAGDRVRWDERGLRVNGKRIRQQDEVVSEDGRVMSAKETIWSPPPARATTWRIQRSPEDGTWQSGVVEVPEGHVYLAADNRDAALDSRWWGPVPLQAIESVARLRIGKVHEPYTSWATPLKGVPLE